jgi:hypothetical protein
MTIGEEDSLRNLETIAGKQNKLLHLVILYPQVVEKLRNLSPDTTLVNSLDLKSFQQVWIFTQAQLFPQKEGTYASRGNFEKEPSLKNYHFFWAKSFQKQ